MNSRIPLLISVIAVGAGIGVLAHQAMTPPPPPPPVAAPAPPPPPAPPPRPTWTMEWFGTLDKLTLGTSVYRAPAAWVGGTVVSLATLIVSTVLGGLVFKRREIAG